MTLARPLLRVNMMMPCPTPDQMRKYLEKNKWKEVSIKHGWTKFEKQFPKNGSAAVLEKVDLEAVLDEKYRDYPQRCCDTLHNLEIIERRPSGEVLADILRGE